MTSPSEVQHSPVEEDLAMTLVELKLAEKLAAKWGSKAVTVPLHLYGVEWAMIDPESEQLKALLFFEHGAKWPEDRPYTVRAGRFIRGGGMARILAIPLVAVIMRGKEGTRFASFSTTEDMAETIANRWAVRPVRDGLYEQWLEVPEAKLKQFKG